MKRIDFPCICSICGGHYGDEMYLLDGNQHDDLIAHWVCIDCLQEIIFPEHKARKIESLRKTIDTITRVSEHFILSLENGQQMNNLIEELIRLETENGSEN